MAQVYERWPTIGTYTNGNDTAGQNNTWHVQGTAGPTLSPSWTTVAGSPNTIGPTATETGLKNELLGPDLGGPDMLVISHMHLGANANLTHSARICARVTDTDNYYYAQTARSGGSGYLWQLVKNVAGVTTSLISGTDDPGQDCIVQLSVHGNQIAAKWGDRDWVCTTDSSLTTGNKVMLRTGSDGGVLVSAVQFKNVRFGLRAGIASGLPLPFVLKAA